MSVLYLRGMDRERRQDITNADYQNSTKLDMSGISKAQ